MAGTQICLRRVDPAVIRRLIERHDVTHFCAAPVVLDGLVAHDDRRPASTLHGLTVHQPRRHESAIDSQIVGVGWPWQTGA